MAAAPAKSVLGDEKNAAKLPWDDVIIDVCGPYTKAETGEQHILAYICTALKVPMLEAFISLQSGHFSRALTKCVLRTRKFPDIVRSDRGPEMVSKVNEDFLAIGNAKHVLGAALTPRHQGLGERDHQVMVSNLLMLMHTTICHAHPQEWPSLVPVVECLQATAPQGAHGFSAQDMPCAFSILTGSDAQLAPLRVPYGMPQEDVVKKMFANFREVYGAFARINREQSIAQQVSANRLRMERVFEEGETVFRRMPRGAKMPKHLFPPPSRGPYVADSQPDRFNLIWRDPETNQLVDKGARIPMDQIIAGPRRARLQFAAETDARPMSQLIEGSQYGPGVKKPSGKLAGRRVGWGPLARGAMVAYHVCFQGPKSKNLQIGRVLVNDRDRQTVMLQPYEGQWSGIRIAHRPYYQTNAGYSLEPGPDEAKETVRYDALVSQVELLTGGELTQGCARRLSERGWGLLICEKKVVCFLRSFQKPTETVLQITDSGVEVGSAQPNGEGTTVQRRAVVDFRSMNRNFVAPRALVGADSLAVVGPMRQTGSKPSLSAQVALKGYTELERLHVISKGRTIEIADADLQYLIFGHRVAFLQIFAGR